MAPARVILYSKPECHLCDEASGLLADLARETSLEWRSVDIQSDPALYERFRYQIPVIEIVGGATLAWPTTRERVRRALAAVVGGAG